MAEKKESDKEVIVSDKQPEHTEVTAVRRRPRPAWPLLTVGIYAGVVTLALIILSWMLVAQAHRTNVRSQYGFGQMSGGAMNGGGTSNRSFYGGGQNSRGTRTTPAASGVVTAINGNNLTISGGGKQVAVTKTSSTTVVGDKTDVAVNDTVTITGTTNSDGSITATTITVRNAAPNRAASDTNVPSNSNMVPGA